MMLVLLFAILANMAIWPLLFIIDIAYAFAMSTSDPMLSYKWQRLKYQWLLNAFTGEDLEFEDEVVSWGCADCIGGILAIILLAFLQMWILVPVLIFIALCVARHFTSKKHG